MTAKAEKYSKIKDFLPLGTQSQIAKKHSVSESYVSKILKGERKNLLILGELTSIAKATKAQLASIEEDIDTL